MSQMFRYDCICISGGNCKNEVKGPLPRWGDREAIERKEGFREELGR